MPLGLDRNAGILAFWYGDKNWKKKLCKYNKVMINYDLSIRVIVIPYCIWELLNLDQESTNNFPPNI